MGLLHDRLSPGHFPRWHRVGGSKPTLRAKISYATPQRRHHHIFIPLTTPILQVIHMETISKKSIKGMVFAALFAALTAAVSPVKIPLGFTPVPITLQTLMVLLSGAMLGPGYGSLSMILYVLVGALGMPVFAGGGSGFGALLGPTGGYLFSYFIAAFAVGSIVKIASRKKSAKKKALTWNTVFAMIVGSLIIYAFGATWGKAVTGLGWGAIMAGWVVPFIIGDAIKLLAAAVIADNIKLEKYLS